MHKLLVICGPTATGKTSLGILLAKKFKGEIVSADSRQVYIGMDLATGKDLPRNSKLKIQKFKIGYYLFNNIPVWLTDIVKPNQEFSAADFVGLASKVIKDIESRNKLPIVLGGTGFYIKALIDGVETLGVPPDWTLRHDLEKNSREKLFEMLSRLDSTKAASMNSSDKQNPRRLIRAIEIALIGNSSPNIPKLPNNSNNILYIGLKTNYDLLYKRVDQRIEEQIKLGAEEEIRELLKRGYTWDLPAMSAMGYGIWKPYFEKKKIREQVIKEWKYSEHDYVRRQMTWFKKDKRITWFDISEQDYFKKVEQLVKNWYNSN